MNRPLRFASIALLAALLAGCQGPCEKLEPISITAPAPTGSADFTRFVAAGTSISAGYQSGGLVDRHQVNAFPAIFARQVGKTVRLDGTGTFSEPTVDGNGLNPLLQLRSISPLVISNAGLTPGTPTNTLFPAPYSNLAVPGAIAYDYANTTRYGSGAFPLVTRGPTPIQSQVLAQNPTFVSFEFGANEILGPATAGVSTQTAITNPVAYGIFVNAAMDTLHLYAPTAKVAIFNVPDVTSIPFFTTFKPYTRRISDGAVVTLIGPGNTPMAPTDLVLLTAAESLAAGVGFPVGSYNYVNPSAPATGRPLPGAFILNSGEQAGIGDALQQMNAAIDATAQRPWIVKVDLHALLADLATNGMTLGGTHYTTSFVSGGLFSLDGVHPTDLGHAIIANAMVAAVNARFGTNVPAVDLFDYRTATASKARPAEPVEGAAGAIRVQGLEPSLRALFAR